jgi:hypothetical protein
MMASNVLLDSAALVAQGRVSTEPRLEHQWPNADTALICNLSVFPRKSSTAARNLKRISLLSANSVN